FYANPNVGSHHNRGTTVDVTLYELADGNEADMGYAQDELSERAASWYPGGTSLQRWHRTVLRTALAAEGFRGLRKEWWHFRHIGTRPYRLMNVGLDELGRRP
ncbi:MAG: serine hydrolase, partial [Candidatus Edwardsbacteria bacterium]|nr:serine hydrolase [Candidatus Edwardsbacteria bacterium]